jgi:Right handed beta helix region
MSCMGQNVFFRVLPLAAALFLFTAFHACSAPSHSASAPSPGNSAATFYLDCSASQNGQGTEALPWNSLAGVNAHTFVPGDRLLLNRGTVCAGTLAPQGSGSANAAIVMDAYGTGALPMINGGSAEEALKLFNQQYWEINNLEITGGNLYGIYISGNVPNSTIHHIYLKNLDVHGATYTSTKRADSGEVFISPNGSGEILNDVLIDGVTAHDSHVSEGIFVNAGGAWIEGNGISQPLGSNVTVQNSTAHDIYGDGILIAELNNGLLQKNVVYRSGLCPTCTGSTPVGLWEWYCHTCTVQYNESYANQSWGGDGGDFDIDYYNNNNVVQYNYGHDSAGYCVAFFGAGGRASVDNVFRYNVCSNNGQRSDLAKQGEVFIYTWDQGSLDGVQIYNNTFYWNPAANGPAVSAAGATYSGSDPRFFKNNIIYATVPGMIQTTSGLTFDNNIYWSTSPSSAAWQVGSATYTVFNAYQAATNQDSHGFYSDPMLNSPTYHAAGKPETAFTLLTGSPAAGAGGNVCSGISGCSMGTQDFWGNPLPSGVGYNIGAYQGP